ncbi:ATP-binding protein [Desulfonatronum lacustre]|uniref:ATP-binding protein n=1 Tax=Desulfonatronum lacustre TaxID=66849 RepID=UPI00338F31DA
MPSKTYADRAPGSASLPKTSATLRTGRADANLPQPTWVERMGTGIRDMIRRCGKAGLPEPEIRIDGGFFVLTIRRKKSESGKSRPKSAGEPRHQSSSNRRQPSKRSEPMKECEP